MKYFAILANLLCLTSCLFFKNSFPCSLGQQVIRNMHPEFSMAACGGSGPEEMYETIRLSFDLGRGIHLKNDRKEILDTQKYLIDEINQSQQYKKYFVEFPVNKKNVSISFLSPGYLKQSWMVCIIGCYSKCIGYTTYWSSEDDWAYYDYGQETYEEAERVAYGMGPFDRIITHTKYGLNHVPIELHGPWGFFIQRAVIEQIKEGDFIYYALIDNVKHKLGVDGDQVVIESSGKPIVDIFQPEPWTP